MMLTLPREDDPLPVKTLNRMTEGRPVRFGEKVGTDLDHIVWAHPHKESIKGRVVQVAEGKAIRHNRLTLWVAVR
jgi:hypothetical protein